MMLAGRRQLELAYMGANMMSVHQDIPAVQVACNSCCRSSMCPLAHQLVPPALFIA